MSTATTMAMKRAKMKRAALVNQKRQKQVKDQAARTLIRYMRAARLRRRAALAAQLTKRLPKNMIREIMTRRR